MAAVRNRTISQSSRGGLSITTAAGLKKITIWHHPVCPRKRERSGKLGDGKKRESGKNSPLLSSPFPPAVFAQQPAPPWRGPTKRSSEMETAGSELESAAGGSRGVVTPPTRDIHRAPDPQRRGWLGGIRSSGALLSIHCGTVKNQSREGLFPRLLLGGSRKILGSGCIKGLRRRRRHTPRETFFSPQRRDVGGGGDLPHIPPSSPREGRARDIRRRRINFAGTFSPPVDGPNSPESREKNVVLERQKDVGEGGGVIGLFMQSASHDVVPFPLCRVLVLAPSSF